jgi:azurin
LKGGELPYRVTTDDNGQTYSATPGKNLVLMLGTDYNWNIASSDDNILAKRDVKVTDARVQGVYQLVGAGKAVLSATGTCKSQSKCASPTAKFTFNIESVISENETPENLVK